MSRNALCNGHFLWPFIVMEWFPSINNLWKGHGINSYLMKPFSQPLLLYFSTSEYSDVVLLSKVMNMVNCCLGQFLSWLLGLLLSQLLRSLTQSEFYTEELAKKGSLPIRGLHWQAIQGAGWDHVKPLSQSESGAGWGARGTSCLAGSSASSLASFSDVLLLSKVINFINFSSYHSSSFSHPPPYSPPVSDAVVR